MVHTIDLTYVGLGIHEELVAYVADQENYFAQEGVHVAIHDGCAWDGERLRRTATIGLGRAVLSRLTDGPPWTVLCVNTHRPLFWLACPLLVRLGGGVTGAPDRHPRTSDRAGVFRSDRAAAARARPGP